MPTGDPMRRLPAHAGRLPLWERLAFALVLLVMAGAIAVIVITSGPPQRSASPAAPRNGSTPAASPAVDGGGTTPGSAASAGQGAPLPALTAAENQRLAAALAPVLARSSAGLAVGVVDGRAAAVYRGGRAFRAGTLVGADVLAALLLQHQRAGTPLSDEQRRLATQMIGDGDAAATGALWDAAGRSAGLAAANRLLGLAHTTPGSTWRLTRTTAADQLQLLADLTAPGSLLPAADRSYELGLMRHAAAGQQWGVAAAAAPGTSPAVASAWIPGGASAAWVVDSVGVISRDGHQVLVTVLSDGQPTELAGIGQVEAAVRAAVTAITSGHATAAGVVGVQADRAR
jgi:hypothetical protein